EYWGSEVAPNPDGTAFVEVFTNGNYRQFSSTSSPEKNYFYRVEAMPVIDPGMKFLRELPYEEDGIHKGFATMWRLTVTVRGPLQTVAEAQEDAWANNILLRKKAVEAKLATYVS